MLGAEFTDETLTTVWSQVVLVIIFWFWRVLRGDPSGPRLLWIRRANRALSACWRSRSLQQT